MNAAHHTRPFRWFDELTIDARYVLRRLCARPATTTLAIAMLAAAVGLSTAMFTLVDAMIVRPLPFPHAERLTSLYLGSETGGSTLVSAPIFAAWRNNPGLERLEGKLTQRVVVDTVAGPVSQHAALVTPGLFDLLGATPLRGRLFNLQAPEPDGVVISASLWRQAFAGDENIVGKTIQLDGKPHIVIGVMPSTFRFPERHTALWRASHVGAPGVSRIQPIARLAPGVPATDAFRVATQLAHAAEPATASLYARRGVLIPVADAYYQRAVPFVAGAVLLVAIVLCANVSGLLLTRLRARHHEFGVCTALGASRARLLRQTVLESVATGLCGAVVGVALAWGLVTLAESLLPEAFRRASLNPIDLDLRALTIAMVMGTVTTLLTSVAPLWIATRHHGNVANPLVERGGTDSRAGRRIARGLLITEVAVACALLVGASLMTRSFMNIAAIDRGFDPSGMVQMWFSFEESGITEPASRRLAADHLRTAIQALPGVTAAAWSTSEGIHFGPWTSDAPGLPPADLTIQLTAVDPDYFPLHGIELLNGRTFLPTAEPNAVIVGETISRTLWPGLDPIGRTFEFNNVPLRVVGVVREPRQSLLDEGREYADMFVPFQGPRHYVWLTVRCAVACPSEGVFRQRTAEASLARLAELTYLDDAFAHDLEQPRGSAALVAVFASVALIAAAGGLFSVLSHAVQERRREFGIRSALGATPGEIRTTVYREGLIVGASGLVIGGLLTVASASALEAVSYEASPFDPESLVLVLITLGATILLALWRPARSAASTDPAELLREH